MKPTGQERRGHGFGLHTRLLESWSQRHCLHMLKDSGSVNENDVPTESPCRKNLFCTCGNVKDGADAYFFHAKMVSLLRPYLFAKREKRPKEEDKSKKPAKVQTKARKALSKAFLVLELRPTGLEQLPVIADQAFASWAPRTSPAGSSKSMQRLWFHIGYCNFKNMQWTGLKMECVSSRNNGEDDVEQVELAVKNPVECFRCYEFLQCHAAFASKYEAHFWALRSTRLGLSQTKMIPHKLMARPFASIPPLLVWKGSADEARDRDALLAAEREKKNKAQKGKKRAAPKERIGKYMVPKRSRTAGSGNRALQDNALDSPHHDDSQDEEPEVEESRHSDIGSGSSGSSDAEDEDGFELDLDEIFSPSQTDSSSSDSDTSETGSPDNAADISPEGSQGQALDVDGSAANPAASSAAGDTSEVAPPEPVPEPPEPASGSGRQQHQRDMYPDVIKIGTWGELRFHKKTKNIVAHCSAHSDEHDCRRSRTTIGNANRQGQGRPIGLLVAWLRDPASHDQGRLSVHNHATRKAAREYYNKLPNAEQFGFNERKQHAGEEEEPKQIP